MSGYIERALIKLKREYGREELFSTLINQVREKDFRIGELTSEVDELKHEVGSAKTKCERKLNDKARKEVRKEELYQQLSEQRARLSQRVKNLKNQINTLIAK